LGGNNSDKFAILKESVFTKVHESEEVSLKVFFEFVVEEISENTNYFTRKE
jgi:hypothetical protein